MIQAALIWLIPLWSGAGLSHVANTPLLPPCLFREERNRQTEHFWRMIERKIYDDVLSLNFTRKVLILARLCNNNLYL